MSVVEDNPWLIVVMEDNEEELPAAIPKNWLVDNNTNVVWIKHDNNKNVVWIKTCFKDNQFMCVLF